MSKGDWRRPTLEDDAKVTESWCNVFGHRWVTTFEWCVCNNCGKTKQEVGEAGR